MRHDEHVFLPQILIVKSILFLLSDVLIHSILFDEFFDMCQNRALPFLS